MGVRLVLVAISDATLDRIAADPPLIWRLLDPENPASYLEELRRRSLRGRNILVRLFGRPPKESAPSPPVPALPLADIEGQARDLDKAADSLHFLLTHAAPDRRVLGFLQEGGAPAGDVEVSYDGPAIAFRSAQAREIAEALRALPRAALEAAFDPPAMKRIYPWYPGVPRPEDLAYLIEYFGVATQFIERVVAHGLGFLRYPT